MRPVGREGRGPAPLASHCEVLLILVVLLTGVQLGEGAADLKYNSVLYHYYILYSILCITPRSL